MISKWLPILTKEVTLILQLLVDHNSNNAYFNGPGREKPKESLEVLLFHLYSSKYDQQAWKNILRGNENCNYPTLFWTFYISLEPLKFQWKPSRSEQNKSPCYHREKRERAQFYSVFSKIRRR